MYLKIEVYDFRGLPQSFAHHDKMIGGDVLARNHANTGKSHIALK
jgi:hypothetical protein